MLENVPTDDEPKDPPLPSTVGFVIGLGLFIVVGWFLMFRLLLARW